MALLIAFVLLLALMCGLLWFYADRASTLHSQRTQLRLQATKLQSALDQANAHDADVSKQLATRTAQLSQITGDAQGKDAVIKSLQDDSVAKQAQIDSLTQQKADLKGCLDGLTLAMVQLTNNSNTTAHATLDGSRDACSKAEVLF